MKRWSKKVWLSAVTLVIAVMSVSAIPASADVSRVVYFSIQSNTLCGEAQGQYYYTQFYFNVNNLSNSQNEVTVQLYSKNGTQLSTAGMTSWRVASDFTPGVPQVIDPNATIQYFTSYSQNEISCDDRPTYGKIVVHGNSGLVMASGEVNGMKRITNSNGTPSTNLHNYENSTVIVNGGQPF